MNAVERIEAAIAKLEKLKTRGTDGPWRAGAFHFDGTTVSNSVGRVAAHYVPVNDAALIVTLHRTIDAQLAILRDGLARRYAGVHPGVAVLALADAILGGDLHVQG